MEIYWISGSAPAWRVLYMLEEKSAGYESRILETSKKEQKQDWFLNLNPRGQVPLLCDGETTVSESVAIMHYLERRFPEPALFGTSASEAAMIEQSVQETLAYVDKAISAFVQPVFRNKADDIREKLPEIAESIHAELGSTERALEKHEWLAGAFSAADITLLPTIQRLKRATQKAPELADDSGLRSMIQTYPRIAAWSKAMESRPAFEASFPPHWR